MPYGVDMPVPDVKNWRSRLHELQGYKVWSTSFLAWLHLMSDRYQAEVREALVLNVDLVFSQLDREQQVRGRKLLSFCHRPLQAMRELRIC